jgi:hypothetical protein
MNRLGDRRCRARRPQPQRPMRPPSVVVVGGHGKLLNLYPALNSWVYFRQVSRAIDLQINSIVTIRNGAWSPAPQSTLKTSIQLCIAYQLGPCVYR